MKTVQFATGTVVLEDDSPLFQVFSGPARPGASVPRIGAMEALLTKADADEMMSSLLVLEGLHERLRKFPPHQPIKPGTAAALSVAVESIRQRCYLPPAQVFVLENFQGLAARNMATKVAVEGLKDTIKQLVMKIVAWIKHVMTGTFQNLESSVKGATTYKRHISALRDQAAHLKAKIGNPVLKVQFTEQPFVAYFTEGGHTDINKILTAYSKHFQSFNDSFSNEILGQAVKYLRQIASDLLQNTSPSHDEVKGHVVAEVDKALRWLQKTAFRHFDWKGDQGTMELPFGNKAFNVSYTAAEGNYISMGAAINDMGDGGHQHKGSLPVLTPDEIFHAAAWLEDEMNKGIYRDYNKIKNELADMASTITKTCDKIAQHYASSGPGAVAALNFLKSIAQALVKLTHYAYAYSDQVNKQLTDYCLRSLRVNEKAVKDPSLANKPTLEE